MPSARERFYGAEAAELQVRATFIGNYGYAQSSDEGILTPLKATLQNRKAKTLLPPYRWQQRSHQSLKNPRLTNRSDTAL